MKAYVYFAIIAMGGCAYGVTPEQELPHDGGVIHVDAGTKDGKAPPQEDAGAADVSVDPPDVSQTTECASLPLATGLPSCDSCLGASCCDEDQQCGLDQDCIAFVDCLDACLPSDGGAPDPQCESTCETDYPNGANELANLDSCMQSSCSGTCF